MHCYTLLLATSIDRQHVMGALQPLYRRGSICNPAVSVYRVQTHDWHTDVGVAVLCCRVV